MNDGANQSAAATAKHPDHFLLEWRQYRGWTQEELGAMADVSHSKISRIESGVTDLKAGFLRKLARIFKLPPVALLTVNPMGEGRETAEMLDTWAKIDPADRARALRSLRVFMRDDDTKAAG